jgi:23S rRNA pseudouridine1911/1915/1917 synthase
MNSPDVTYGEYAVANEHEGLRLDAYLVAHVEGYSRTQLRNAISSGEVLVDGRTAKPAYRLKADQTVSVAIAFRAAEGPEPEDIPLTVLYEDDQMAVVNKPAGMVVHPAKGHWAGTLASALAFHFGRLSSVGGVSRPGIVHRLDRDTTGAILVAKTDAAHQMLAAQFEAREVEKEYHAIVRGVPNRDRDRIDQPLGVHPYQREKMAIRADHATTRAAVTEYEVAERFPGFALLRVFPKTGRTHQIRVHLTHAGYPILCDRLYAGHALIRTGELQRTDDPTVLLDRQALHAARISFTHPVSGQRLEVSAPLATDMQRVLDVLRAN